MSAVPVQIADRSSRRVVMAEAVTDLSQEDLNEVDKAWRAFRERAMRRGPLPENEDWRWKLKKLYSGEGVYRFLGLRYAGEMQGLAMLNMEPVSSRRPNCSDQQAIYVEFIETAPWNQGAYAGNDRRFDRVGMALLSISIQASLAAGCGGRLALHSLAQSEGFYRLSFEDLGIDPAENLRYFELDTERALEMLTGEKR
jgi:hypothetical protein